MARYDPLTNFLNALEGQETRLSFKKIESVIGRKLPASAHTYNAWWSNTKVEGRQSYAWLDAGWATYNIDLLGQKISFKKVSSANRQATEVIKPVVKTASLPVHASKAETAVEIQMAFSWRGLGALSSDANGKLVFPKTPRTAGLYRFRIEDHHYVGETMNLGRRFQQYRNPGITQRTNIRINKRLRQSLLEGQQVHVDILTDDVSLSINGADSMVELGNGPTRRMIENAVLVGEASEGIKSLIR
jgi:hypothetical protein